MICISIGEEINKIRKELPNNVTLVAVSKTKPIDDIMEAYDVGIRNFGENKVQELTEKEEALPKDILWHLIGKLQTNKVKYIVGKVHLIHSLSSIKLLNKIEAEYEKANMIANTLIQINIGKEESKSGFLEEELDEVLKEIQKCKCVKVKGLMVIIPKGNSENNKHYFNKTKELFDKFKLLSIENLTMEILSMGMSNDFLEAVESGSTMVRVGSKIFGTRQ